MPIITLSESQPGSLNYLLQPLNYTQLYNKLKTILTTDEMLLFTRPDIYDASTNWSADLPSGFTRSQIQLYMNLPEKERIRVEEKLSLLKDSITGKLKSNKELSDLSDSFFKIPSTEDIYVLNIGGEYIPIFTRWGCSLVNMPMDTNPLNKVLEKFNLPISEVTLSFRYSNGKTASNYPFLYSFAGKESVHQTDAEGLYKLGRIRSGTSFSVYEIRNNQKGEGFDFVSMEGQSYSITIPVYTNGSVLVKNQKDIIQSNKTIRVFHNGNLEEYMTDSNGRVLLKGLRIGQDIEFSDINNPAIKSSYEVKENDAEYLFVIKEQIATNVSIKVQDANKTNLANYPVLVKIGETETVEYKTNSDGIINIPGCTPGNSILISDKNKLNNRINYVLQEGENEFLLFSDRIASNNFVRFRIVNHRNEILPNIPVGLNYRNQLVNHTTDQNGEFVLPKDYFLDETKISTSITTKKIDKKGNVIDKIINKQFTYTSNKDLYIIKLDKFNKAWWWLLLLLLPLLLLIRFDKNVYVKYQHPNGVSVIKDADVYLSYHKQMLLDSGSFFTDNLMEYNEKTNDKGVANFVKLEYSLYSFLFHYNSPLKVYIKSNCYENDTLSMKFHAIWNWRNDTVFVKARTKLVYLDFRVVDEITNYPIRRSKVKIVAEDGGLIYRDSSYTNSEGLVGFNVPICGKLKWSVADKAGYYSDSLNNLNIEEIYSDDIQQRLYKLLPIETNENTIPDSLYTNDIIDDVTDRGGHFGELSVSLAWNNTDDIDLYLQEPNGNYIFYRNKISPSGGQLELDIIVPQAYSNPIEHIYWNSNPMPGVYKVFANCYSHRDESNSIPVKLLVNNGGATKLIEAEIGRTNNPPGKLIYQFRYPE